MSFIKLYPHRLACWNLTAVTDEGAGHAKEYMLDTQKITHWQSYDASGSKYIEIDCGEVTTIDSCILYYYGGGAGHSIGLYADNNSDYSTETLIAGSSRGIGDWGYYSLPGISSSSYRYWRLRFFVLGTAVKVSQVYLTTEKEISVNINYGDVRGIDYGGVKLFQSRSGNISADIETPATPYQNIAWDMLDVTNKNKLDDVLAITNGRQYPMFMLDSDEVLRFGRFINDNLGAIRTNDGIYNIPILKWRDELGSPE